MNEVSRQEFSQLVRTANLILVAVKPPNGVTVYFEISADVAEVKADDMARDRIPFEMDKDRFLWIGDPGAPLRVAL